MVSSVCSHSCRGPDWRKCGGQTGQIGIHSRLYDAMCLAQGHNKRLGWNGIFTPNLLVIVQHALPIELQSPHCLEVAHSRNMPVYICKVHLSTRWQPPCDSPLIGNLRAGQQDAEPNLYSCFKRASISISGIPAKCLSRFSFWCEKLASTTKCFSFTFMRQRDVREASVYCPSCSERSEVRAQSGCPELCMLRATREIWSPGFWRVRPAPRGVLG